MKLNPPGALVVAAVLPKLNPGVLEGACDVWKGLFMRAAVDWPKVKLLLVGGCVCALCPKLKGFDAGWFWFWVEPNVKLLLVLCGWGVEPKKFVVAAG